VTNIVKLVFSTENYTKHEVQVYSTT